MPDKSRLHINCTGTHRGSPAGWKTVTMWHIEHKALLEVRSSSFLQSCKVSTFKLCVFAVRSASRRFSLRFRPIRTGSCYTDTVSSATMLNETSISAYYFARYPLLGGGIESSPHSLHFSNKTTLFSNHRMTPHSKKQVFHFDTWFDVTTPRKKESRLIPGESPMTKLSCKFRWSREEMYRDNDVRVCSRGRLTPPISANHNRLATGHNHIQRKKK